MKSRINVYLNNEIEKLAFLEKYEFLLPWEGGTNIREFNPISTRGTLNAPPKRKPLGMHSKHFECYENMNLLCYVTLNLSILI